MSFAKLLEAALVLVVSFAVDAFFKAIGVAVDAGTFTAIVAGIVAWLLGLFVADNVRIGLRNTRVAKFL